MAIADIKAFSEKAKADPELKGKLLACMKIKEILGLAKEYGFELDEVELYPPNEAAIHGRAAFRKDGQGPAQGLSHPASVTPTA